MQAPPPPPPPLGTTLAYVRGRGPGSSRIEDVAHLWEEFEEYREFMKEEAFTRPVTHVVGGAVAVTRLRTVNALTITSFCAFLGVHLQAWYRWMEKRDDLRDDLWNYISDVVHADKAAQ